jgi:hypothetical protein
MESFVSRSAVAHRVGDGEGLGVLLAAQHPRGGQHQARRDTDEDGDQDGDAGQRLPDSSR